MLGFFEQAVLSALMALKPEDAYGMRIRQEVEGLTEKTASIGAVYTTLDRLEDKGFVTSESRDATHDRLWRAKRFFKIEASGVEALYETRRAQNALWWKCFPEPDAP